MEGVGLHIRIHVETKRCVEIYWCNLWANWNNPNIYCFWNYSYLWYGVFRRGSPKCETRCSQGSPWITSFHAVFLDSPSSRLQEEVSPYISNDRIQKLPFIVYRLGRRGDRSKNGFYLQWRRETVSHGFLFYKQSTESPSEKNFFII